MHSNYFLLCGGLERALYRMACMHVGSQYGGWLCRVEVLRDKTGSDAQPKEFNRMLRRVIEADQLPNYAMELTETTDRSPAVRFRRRGEVEARALAEQMIVFRPIARTVRAAPTCQSRYAREVQRGLMQVAD